MSMTYRYTLPVEQTEWKFDGKAETCFTWEYGRHRCSFMRRATSSDEFGARLREARLQ